MVCFAIGRMFDCRRATNEHSIIRIMNWPLANYNWRQWRGMNYFLLLFYFPFNFAQSLSHLANFNIKALGDLFGRAATAGMVPD